jgi:chromosome segregation ATPase
MFGSKKIQELEARVAELTESLSKQQEENASLTQQLESAKSQIAGMEAQLNDFDLEQAKEEAKASRAEYEGLKELYSRKTREFDEFKEGEEQRFARDQALQRHNLENEIRDNRQANQEYVANTVKTFGESYNYYLNQIKVLMDALGNVAARTGAALFQGENADLRSSFGHQMRDLLKSGVEAFDDDEEKLVVEAEDAGETANPAEVVRSVDEEGDVL